VLTDRKSRKDVLY